MRSVQKLFLFFFMCWPTLAQDAPHCKVVTVDHRFSIDGKPLTWGQIAAQIATVENENKAVVEVLLGQKGELPPNYSIKDGVAAGLYLFKAHALVAFCSDVTLRDRKLLFDSRSGQIATVLVCEKGKELSLSGVHEANRITFIGEMPVALSVCDEKLRTGDEGVILTLRDSIIGKDTNGADIVLHAGSLIIRRRKPNWDIKDLSWEFEPQYQLLHDSADTTKTISAKDRVVCLRRAKFRDSDCIALDIGSCVVADEIGDGWIRVKWGTAGGNGWVRSVDLSFANAPK